MKFHDENQHVTFKNIKSALPKSIELRFKWNLKDYPIYLSILKSTLLYNFPISGYWVFEHLPRQPIIFHNELKYPL